MADKKIPEKIGNYYTPERITKKILAEYHREYRKKNAEKIKEHIKKYRQTHEKYYKNYLHDYYDKNKKKILNERKKQRISSAYRLNERKRARKRRDFLRSEVFKALGNKCALCGYSDSSSLVIDHKIPFSRYRANIQKTYEEFQKDSTHLINYQVLCGNCHVKKKRKIFEI